MKAEAERVLLEAALRKLNLTALAREYPECARQALEQGAGYESFLLDALTREVERRDENRLKRWLREARFPQMKPLETVDFAKWPGMDRLRFGRLAACEYLERGENVILIGKHGTGKTHAATALGIEACRHGHRARFHATADLVNKLVEARSEKELESFLRKTERVPLLIVDELGYIPLSVEGAQLLFQVIAKRHERASVLITTNLPFQRWTEVFGDANLTAALLDRLTHRCHILNFNWESVRFIESLNRAKGGTATTTEKTTDQRNGDPAPPETRESH